MLFGCFGLPFQGDNSLRLFSEGVALGYNGIDLRPVEFDFISTNLKSGYFRHWIEFITVRFNCYDYLLNLPLQRVAALQATDGAILRPMPDRFWPLRGCRSP